MATTDRAYYIVTWRPAYARLVSRDGAYQEVGDLVSRPVIVPVAAGLAKRVFVGYDPLEFGWELAMDGVAVLEPTR